MLQTRRLTLDPFSRELFPSSIYGEGCVLYAPLWQEDMQGSPLLSYDTNHFALTVTGAVWTPQGRTFDKLDDVIDCGSATVLDNLTGAQTHMAWINPTDAGEGDGGRIFDKGMFYIRMAANPAANFVITVTGIAKIATSAANSVPYGSWTCLFAIYDGTNVLIETNGTTVTGDASAGPVDDHSAGSLFIGDNVGSTRCFNGRIGEVIAWNRALSVGKRTRVRQATQWRYK